VAIKAAPPRWPELRGIAHVWPIMPPPPLQTPIRKPYPKILVRCPAAKAGRFLFKQEPKTYELTVLPWFALDQTHDTDIVRKRVDLKVSGGRLGTGSNLLDCAERSSPEGAAFDGESADRAIMDVDEIGHCLRDRVPNFTDQVP